ncbi:MAG: S-layer homology domain-containing protein [Bifidobacteriaceae bacterium]|jgi:hypothetical protein|nr:S-layer homology domain-containing protein [Bifidobacteriaceae bacterium]
MENTKQKNRYLNKNRGKHANKFNFGILRNNIFSKFAVRKFIILPIAVAGLIIILGLITSYLFFSTSARASAAPGAPASISISKIGKNSIKANWSPASNATPKNAELVLNNIYTKRVYVKDNIPGDAREYTFENISTGLYTAQICFDSTNCNSVSSNSKEPVSIFLDPGKKPNFTDISYISPENQKYINWVATYGIAKGYADGKYRPAKGVTREQMASLIYRLAGNPSAKVWNSPFTDLVDNDHKAAIIWATSRNILQGYDCDDKHIPYFACTAAGTKIFQGNKTITRSQVALEIYRYAAFPAMSEDDIKQNLAKIKDAKNLTTAEERIAVAWLLKEAIVSGYEDGNYRASSNLSRYQMAKIMHRVSKLFSTISFLQENKTSDKFLNTSVVRPSITSIKFIDVLPVCDNPMDVSYNNSRNILACVDGGQMVVGQAGGVIANPFDSCSLFYNLSNPAGVDLDLKYFDATYTKGTKHMFATDILNNLILPAEFAKNAFNMESMFSLTTVKGSFVLPDDFGENADNLAFMFQSANLPKDFKIPAKLAKNATNNINMFRSATINSPLVFSKYFGQKFTEIHGLFNQATINADITFLGTLENVVRGQLFDGAKINGNLHFPEYFLANCASAYQMFAFSTIKGNIVFPKGFLANAVGGSYYHFLDTEIYGDITFPADFGQNGMSTAYMFQNSKIFGNIIFLEGFGTKFGMDMSGLFQYAKISGNIILPNGFGQNGTKVVGLFQHSTVPASFLTVPESLGKNDNLEALFAYVVLPDGFVLPNDFGSNAQSISALFSFATVPDSLTLPKTFGQKAEEIGSLFRRTKLPNGFILPKDFGSLAVGMSDIFEGTRLPINFSLPAGFGQNATILNYAFSSAVIPDGFVLPEKFGQNATHMANMFQSTFIPSGFVLPNDFGQSVVKSSWMFFEATLPVGFNLPAKFCQKAVEMRNMFQKTKILGGLILPADFAKSADNVNYMFQNASLSAPIDWSGTDLTNSQASKTYMFKDVTWNGQFVLARNSGSVAFLISDTGGTNANIKVKGS